MPREEIHDRLIAAELFWFGGVQEPPKTYDPGTSNHADPDIRGTVGGGHGGDTDVLGAEVAHWLVYDSGGDDHAWEVRVDDAG